MQRGQTRCPLKVLVLKRRLYGADFGGFSAEASVAGDTQEKEGERQEFGDVSLLADLFEGREMRDISHHYGE